jgi:hypothetical protein
MRFWVFLFIAVLFRVPAFGGSEDFPPLGKHYPLFVFEKSENPQNILIPYVKLNSACQFEADAQKNQPTFDFYWLMDRKRFKPVHPLIKREIFRRLQFVSESEDRHRFIFKLVEMNDVKQDLNSNDVTVVAKVNEHDGCEVAAELSLGPSDGNRRIVLEKIYTESRKTLWPPFRKVKAITLKGKVAGTGEEIARTYRAR